MEAILALARNERQWSAQCDAQVCHTHHNVPKRPRQAGEPPNIIEGQHHTSSKKQTKLYLRPHGLFLNVLMTFWTVNERWIQVSFETFMARLV